MTDSLLERSQRIVGRWRNCINEWSRHPSRPIPSTWRTAAVTALDDDLDMSRLVAMMHELDKAEVVEPGAKFEAFAYVDRVLAVDLMRNLGRGPSDGATGLAGEDYPDRHAHRSEQRAVLEHHPKHPKDFKNPSCRYPTGR